MNLFFILATKRCKLLSLPSFFFVFEFRDVCLEFRFTLLLGRRQLCLSLLENRMAVSPTSRSPSPLILPHFSRELFAKKN